MGEIKEIIDEIVRFRDERDWKQFHDTKNLAVAISIEAAELNELFLWKSPADCEKVDKARIREELAGIFTYALLLAEKHDLDVREIILEKAKANAKKYPVEKSRGRSTKYTEL